MWVDVIHREIIPSKFPAAAGMRTCPRRGCIPHNPPLFGSKTALVVFPRKQATKKVAENLLSSAPLVNFIRGLENSCKIISIELLIRSSTFHLASQFTYLIDLGRKCYKKIPRKSIATTIR